ncbi:MAG: hypothetical protein ACLT8E_10555 [Akkermansia sp.]
MTSVWNRELPLDEAISLIGVLDRRQEELRGGMLPFLPEPEEARAMYANCVIYRDPDDPGHTVRLMPGIPESPVRQARAPYVVHAWNGVYWTAGVCLRRPSGIPIFRWSAHRRGRGAFSGNRSGEPRPVPGPDSGNAGDADAQERWWWNRSRPLGASWKTSSGCMKSWGYAQAI